MANEDPPKAMERVLSLDTADSTYVTDAFREWYDSDRDKANAWYQANSNKIPAEEYEKITIKTKVYVRYSFGQFSEGIKELEKLTNPAVREREISYYLGYEHNQLSRIYDGKPEKLMSDVFDPSNGYTDYAIHPALELWMKKSPTDATQWYDEHKSTLNPTQQQAAAAAFAIESARLKDRSLAEQWLSQINDARLRDRVSEALKQSEKAN